MDVLRCDGLQKSFDGACALASVRLQLPTMGITAIIGPNGAGKTTLVNILTGFLRADAGQCYFGDRDITRLPPHAIVRLGVARTFQDLRLVLQVSVLENLLLAVPHQRGETLLGAVLRIGLAEEEDRNRQKAFQLLRLVKLEALAQELAGELSYGQQKLLTLLCCVATQARTLLLDEPVAGVDRSTAVQVLALLRQLRDEGHCIVFIEHDIGAVREIADHVIVMDEGTIIAQGPPRDVLERPEIMEAYLA